MKPLLLALAFVVLGGAIVAQAPPQPPSDQPVLSEVNRLKLQVISQKIELAQLKAQAAQREFDDARTELSSVLKSLEVPGWTFDIQTLSYKRRDPPKEPK